MGRSFLGIRFQCCSVYVRAHKNPQGDAYQARCPRCGRRVRIRVGPDGTSRRFFLAHPRRRLSARP